MDAQQLIREARNRVLKALYAFILEQNPEEAPTRFVSLLSNGIYKFQVRKHPSFSASLKGLDATSH